MRAGRCAALVSVVCLASATAIAGPPRQSNDAVPPAAKPDFPRVIRQYCVTCHNERLKTGGLLLDRLDFTNLPGAADTWEKVIRKLRAGMMPPPGAPRPDQVTADGLLAWVAAPLDREAVSHPNPGRPLVHRLNRAEYANAIRDLLALDVDVASL